MSQDERTRVLVLFFEDWFEGTYGGYIVNNHFTVEDMEEAFIAGFKAAREEQ